MGGEDFSNSVIGTNLSRYFLVSLFVLPQKVTKKGKSAESYPRSVPPPARSADLLPTGVPLENLFEV
jgi:hypothetical protein